MTLIHILINVGGVPISIVLHSSSKNHNLKDPTHLPQELFHIRTHQYLLQLPYLLEMNKSLIQIQHQRIGIRVLFWRQEVLWGYNIHRLIRNRIDVIGHCELVLRELHWWLIVTHHGFLKINSLAFISILVGPNVVLLEEDLKFSLHRTLN